MYVSWERPEQIEDRLRKVIRASALRWFEQPYAFAEYEGDRLPVHEEGMGLAFVRDESGWSVLRPALPDSREVFAIFSFHFPAQWDNSGFVGWLASRFKAELGTGVFVICGQNSAAGGIFDYWGVPIELKGRAAMLIEELRAA